MKVGEAVRIPGDEYDRGVLEGTIFTTRQVILYRPDGSIYDIKTQYFLQSGASGFGRIGCWVDFNGTPVDNDVHVLDWEMDNTDPLEDIINDDQADLLDQV